MPSSPNTSCNFGDMQNMDYRLGIEVLGTIKASRRPALSLQEASPGITRAAARGSRGERDACGGKSCLNAPESRNAGQYGLAVGASVVSARWARVSFCSCACCCYARQPGMLSGRVKNEVGYRRREASCCLRGR